ncbi:unnamed protein product [Rotaria magnacalcarata]|uniref:Uncharacterized protein n=3 Tax=Rotaria magnacalcarata TaxID=392030 RepID=A0A816YS92_9BILA|nr:unnamed protein product [Rotaria magnacalcarata]CAF1990035.1 unnamed protein product [Rotaria magnacalcarata]CAF2153543.1 unnamed protein product [Rotaria magnacalcarata]CAF2163049.1 unnamed protein product [Rotaria magnacalcarata]CAF4024886.1 unnamed protein product [Rotaria magnacalcarata]
MTLYNYAKITEATIYKRPKKSGPDLVGHWDGVVSVEGYGNYLIHNTPELGALAIPVSNLNPPWTSVRRIPVGKDKTIRGCFLMSGGAHTNDVSSELARYIMGETCVGAMAAIAEYLIFP